MTLKEFAKTLDGREYGHEITKEEEILAKELGFVVVFGYSDDNAELRGAIYDEIGCYDGGILKHDDLPDEIYADWCPDDIDCAWAYGTSIPHETFHIYDDGELYCVGIVCDINKPKQTNADRIRAMSDEELAEFIRRMVDGSNAHEVACYGCIYYGTHHSDPENKETDLYKCDGCRNEGIGLDVLKWLRLPMRETHEGEGGGDNA